MLLSAILKREETWFWLRPSPSWWTVSCCPGFKLSALHIDSHTELILFILYLVHIHLLYLFIHPQSVFLFPCGYVLFKANIVCIWTSSFHWLTWRLTLHCQQAFVSPAAAAAAAWNSSLAGRSGADPSEGSSECGEGHGGRFRWSL